MITLMESMNPRGALLELKGEKQQYHQYVSIISE